MSRRERHQYAIRGQGWVFGGGFLLPDNLFQQKTVSSPVGDLPFVEEPFYVLPGSNSYRVRVVCPYLPFHNRALRTPNSQLWFTPLESPGINADDVRNRKRQLLIEGGGKALPFLTGFTLFFNPF